MWRLPLVNVRVRASRTSTKTSCDNKVVKSCIAPPPKSTIRWYHGINQDIPHGVQSVLPGHLNTFTRPGTYRAIFQWTVPGRRSLRADTVLVPIRKLPPSRFPCKNVPETIYRNCVIVDDTRRGTAEIRLLICLEL